MNPVEWAKSHPYATALGVVGVGALLYFTLSGGGQPSGDGSTEPLYGTAISYAGPSDSAISAGTQLQLAGMEKQFATDELAAKLTYSLAELDTSKVLSLRQLDSADRADERYVNYNARLAEIGRELDIAHLTVESKGIDYSYELAKQASQNNYNLGVFGINADVTKFGWANKSQNQKSKGFNIGIPKVGSFGASW